MKQINLLLACGAMIIALSCSQNNSSDSTLTDSVIKNDTTMQKMINARIFVKADKVNEFIQAAREIVDSSNTEAGCLSYTLYQDPYDNTRFIIVELWKDQQAIDIHFEKSYFKAFGEKTNDWMEKPSEVQIFDVIAAN